MKFTQVDVLRKVMLAGAIAGIFALSGVANAANTNRGQLDVLQPSTTTTIRESGLQPEELLMPAQLDQLSAGDAKRDVAQPMTIALVSSCKESWYGRSLIQEFACGFSGQGWFNLEEEEP
jgi:hypothetical protein